LHLDTCYESTCQGKFDGVYPDTTQACRRFYRCFEGQIMNYENCRQGFLHNGKVCDYADRVNCDAPKAILRRSCSTPMEDCKFLPDGLHTDESSKDCKSYFKCFGGKILKHRCPSSSVFHPIEKNCVPDTLYDCPKSSRLEKLCKGRTDGFYLDPRFGCSHFVKCLRGNPVQFDECGKGQYFDVTRRVCTFSPSNQCQHEPYSSECMSLEMGFYQNRSLDSSCRSYFYCYNGRKTSLSCETGALFNGESCVDERFYNCPNLDADSCDTKSNGYYKDNNLDCRSYFYCSSNRKYSFLCQDGQAFDGSKCVSKRHVEPCSKSLDCSRKSDGYYQDIKSGCTKYHFCKEGNKVQVRFDRRNFLLSISMSFWLKFSNNKVFLKQNLTNSNFHFFIFPSTRF
jgi:Chitin binding Peritrophin-A domain